ncbi:MAG: EFR1 family ferrodoxin [Clostridia bacterium]|nr:EFR1 family ferrodoxin [Clostridia bacterium]
MRVLLIYYTGTFNTRYLSNQLKEKLLKRGDTVDTVEINANTPVADTYGYDLIGFSYPIYGFNSPLPFNQYVRKLKFYPTQKYFIYKNSGETLAMNNASSRILIRLMKRRKVTFAGEYHYVMPYNIHFPFEKEFVKQILLYNQKLMAVMLHNLEHGVVFKIKSNIFYNTAAFFLGVQKIGGNVNSFLYKVDKEKCIQCNKCVNACPHNNIYVKDGKIKFHHHCDMCMRCSFFCPTNAVKIGFLEGWKVNGEYPFDKILKDDTIGSNYITQDSKGFYKCFIKTFAFIDREYGKISAANE